jgi:hypothetical protein
MDNPHVNSGATPDVFLAANARHAFRRAFDALREREALQRCHHGKHGVPACHALAFAAFETLHAFQDAGAERMVAREAWRLADGGPSMDLLDYVRELVVFPWQDANDDCPIHGDNPRNCPHGSDSR